MYFESLSASHRLGERVRAQLHRSRRYTAVAIFCALLHNGIMIGLDRLGLHYALCQTASAAVLLPVGYLLQGRFTFGVADSWRNFARYSAALLTNFPVAIFALWVLCDLLALDMALAAPASMVVLFLWNYMTSSWAFLHGRSGPAQASHG